MLQPSSQADSHTVGSLTSTAAATKSTEKLGVMILFTCQD